MAQVSQRPLPELLKSRIFDILWKTIADVRDKQTVADLLNDLLTRTERIMLAKRLGIAMMLVKGYDHRAISDVLKVSTTTVLSVRNKLLDGRGYQLAAKNLLNDETIKKLLYKIEDVFELLTETRPYSDRWADRRKSRFKEKQKKSLPV